MHRAITHSVQTMLSTESFKISSLVIHLIFWYSVELLPYRLELMTYMTALRKAMKARRMRSHLFLPTIPWKNMYREPLEVHYPCSHLQQGLQLRMFHILRENVQAYLQIFHLLNCPWLRSYMILVLVSYLSHLNHSLYAQTLYIFFSSEIFQCSIGVW